MAYATVDDLRTRFGARETDELLDRNGDEAEDAGVADAILADASAEIDAILAVRYPIPVADSPLLKAICCDLARYRLYDDTAPEIVKERRKQAVAQLQAIAKGAGELLDSNGATVSDRQDDDQAGGATYKQPRERVFTDAGLKGFMGP